MKVFKYVARTADGATYKGKMRGSNRESVVEILQGRDLVVVDVKEDIGLSLERLNEINIGGVPIKEKVRFMRQLATMISAGIPLAKAISILQDQAENPFMKRALSDALADVEGGLSLSEAFKKQNGLFDDIVISLLSAGEASGKLDEILKKISVELDEKKKLQDRIKSAFIYPIILVVIMVLVVVLLMFVLVPALNDIYADSNAALPAPTQLLINMSNSMQHYWWLYLLVTLIGIVLFKYYAGTKQGKRFLDTVILKVPIFGTLIRKVQIAQFTRVLTLLLSSGLSIVEALDLTAKSLSNVNYREVVEKATEEVQKGTSLSLPLSRSDYFPLIISQMVAVGEESGQLDMILQKLSEDYNDEVKVMTENLSTAIEPLMLVIMGGMIGFIAIAVYMPMFTMTEAF